MDLQQRQRDVLARMFTDIPGGASAASASPEMDVLTTPGVSSAAAAAAVSWKVLIYDSFGQSVLASLFSVGELKRLGVTLHLMLHSARDPIHDVPAVYFCRPTAENIARIEKDMSQGVYDSVHLNFTSLPDPAFHSLATRLGRAGVAGSVLTVSDQWSECVSLDPNLFTFSHPHSFASLHAPSLPDATREYWLRRTALGAAGLIAAAGAMPVIRAPPEEGPARAVASLLSQMLRAHPDAVTGSAASSASAGTAAAAASVSTQRPLVVVLDRSSDLASPLHHAWTYLPLIADLLGLKGMRVPVPDGVTSAAAQGGMWDLDPRDPFYAANACAQVSAAAERLTGAVAEYWADAEALKQRTQASSAGADGLAAASTELAGAIASLPALTRRKKQLDIHTSMGPPLLKTIKTRKLDEYHAFEESVLSAAATGGTAGTGAGVDRAALRELVKMKEGTVLDKLRAVLIAYVATESPEMGFYKHIFAELEQLADREGSLITSAKGSSSTASGSPSPAAAAPAAAPGSTKSADDDFAAALMSDGPSSSSSSSAGTQSSASAAEDDIELGLSGAAAPGQRVRRLRPLVSAAIKHAQSAKLAQATMQAIRARASASPSNAGGAAGGAFGGAAGGLFAFARSVIDRSAQALSNFSDKSVMLPVSLTVKALLAADQQQQQMPHHARAAGGAGGAGGVGSSAAAAAAAVSAQFLHFDPLSTRTLPDGQTPPQARVPLGSGIGGRRVIVVMVGGGSYAEYANLQELAAELTEADAAALGGYASSVGGVRPEVSIVYAATELMTPTEFVEAMSELGGPGEARAAVGELIREHGTESFPA